MLKHCPCIAISHVHKSGECDEPAPKTGTGVCTTCRYAVIKRYTTVELLVLIERSNLAYDAKVGLREILERRLRDMEGM